MSQTVGVNALSVVHKSSSAVVVAFPDVCKTPSPAGPVPIPYPSFATKAVAVQEKQKTPGTGLSMKKMSTSVGDEAGVAMQTQTIKTKLNELNMRLQMLAPMDPNQWQAVLQDYAVLASALYHTKKND